MTLAPVLRATHVALPQAQAFALFTDHIGAWWPLTSHGMFGVDSAGVTFEDGRLVERATDGRTTTWGEVLSWDPPQGLTFSWHPGATSGTAAPPPGSRVTVRFLGDEQGTRVELTHDGWEMLGERAAAARSSYAGRDAWGRVLDHLSDLQMRSDDASADPALVDLAAAYEVFFTEALAGGFAEPVDEKAFTAAQVVAHVAVNDDAMSAVCRAVIDGAGAADGVAPPARFENEAANDRTVLQSLVDAHGDLPALVATGRRRAEQLRLLLSRLDGDERGVSVHARLHSDGEVMVDDDLPWGRLAITVQTARHLPAHTDQLRALRPDGVGGVSGS